ncbi:MAG: Rid family hydrolase [Marivibrio sp.]|uniref:RidA family protein n=1 Tax=Marivibrio sp. TaxID=2039719 RepID=UPI0032EF67AE
MAHKRIRPFNTKDTYPEQALDNDLAQAVVARGSMVFVRGQIGQNLETSESVGIGDPAAQAHQAMRNIEMLLKESGAETAHICRLVIYLTDIRFRESVYRVVGQYTKGVHPVSTGLVVSALARPEWLVEIEATAVIPDAETGAGS